MKPKSSRCGTGRDRMSRRRLAALARRTPQEEAERIRQVASRCRQARAPAQQMGPRGELERARVAPAPARAAAAPRGLAPRHVVRRQVAPSRRVLHPLGLLGRATSLLRFEVTLTLHEIRLRVTVHPHRI
ncbi:uncharacterized protein LOC125241151 isoform X2 [Leguminivora glycinivorella]|uniref:uncharacterized protein LOC125241151 isoform X2 n=1 Tax=Leguminivora glycinivorella TaxID=1035111 RepID=UPI00200BBB8C|nr:uncharacterized protein LOC125241151 isoform X2 [Leguminivora glycinivorella]